MRIGIATDHGGFELKEELAVQLREKCAPVGIRKNELRSPALFGDQPADLVMLRLHEDDLVFFL